MCPRTDLFLPPPHLQSKSSLDGLDEKEVQPPLPPKADRYNQLKGHVTSSEGETSGLTNLVPAAVAARISLVFAHQFQEHLPAPVLTRARTHTHPRDLSLCFAAVPVLRLAVCFA